MPSILELFQSKKLSSGQTAEVYYDIRNSKDSNIKTNSGVLDVAMTPLNLLRKNASARLKETRLEEETTGLRIMRTLASPVIYGTGLPKLLTKQSSSTITMKNASNLDSNLVLQKIKKAESKVKSTVSKLGVKFPEQLIPTTVADKMLGLSSGEPWLGEYFDRVPFPISREKLLQIRDGGKGNLLGNILSKPATPNQIGTQLAGAAINSAKKALKNKILGVAYNQKDKQNQNINNSISLKILNNPYNSKNLYTKNIKDRSENFENGNYDLLKKLQDKDISVEAFISKTNERDTLNFANPKSNDFIPFPELDLGWVTQNIPQKRLKSTITYSKTDAVKDYNIENLNKTKFNTKKDLVNISKPWYSTTGDVGKLPDGTTIDDYDFIPLRFYSVAKQTGISFKAVISGLSETFTPSWEPNKFLGNAYSFYTYSSIERTVSFTFKVYSLNIDEHISAWEKLNFLAGCTYPQQTDSSLIHNIPPFMKFTLGDMYKNKECFIDSLSYEVDDNSPWEIGLGAQKSNIRGTRVQRVIERDSNKKNYKLPTIINVNIGLKFVETQGIIAGKRLYGYGGNSQNEKDNGFNLDGSVIINDNKETRTDNKPTTKPQENKQSVSTYKKPDPNAKPFVNGAGPIPNPNANNLNNFTFGAPITFKK